VGRVHSKLVDERKAQEPDVVTDVCADLEWEFAGGGRAGNLEPLRASRAVHGERADCSTLSEGIERRGKEA
jgi:hypothetical protein